MYGFSTVDGFLNVKEGVDEMIKYLANEPSAGLFFVQQHAHTSMPYLLTVKDKVEEKVHKITLHTEDLEDSISVVRSMTECGLPIADEMIRDINRSLLVMSTSQPKKGLIHNPSWGFQAGSGGSNPSAAFVYTTAGSTPENGGSSRGYLSTVFSSAKQKAAALRWPQPDAMARGPKGGQLASSTAAPPSIGTEPIAMSALPDAEGDELLPLSSQLNESETAPELESCSHSHDGASLIQSYDRFKSERESKLEAWLQES